MPTSFVKQNLKWDNAFPRNLFMLIFFWKSVYSEDAHIFISCYPIFWPYQFFAEVVNIFLVHVLSQELPNEKWFCCRECSSIHLSLQELVNEGEKKLPYHLLSTIKEKHEDNGSECESDLNISWRLFYGKMASDEDRKWLSDAVSVFHVSVFWFFRSL